MDKRRDWELLRGFVESNSEEAFTELTRRYLGLVFGTALRELGDRTLAEDVTQGVFLILARKAPQFRQNIVLTTWLFDTCKLTARNARRDERRRQIRERRTAMEMRREQDINGRRGTELGDTLLNEALSALPQADRQAVLLRFARGYTFVETGEALGVSEDAARMRIGRALEKLRKALTRGGVPLTAIAIGDLLQPHAAQAASAGLETQVCNLIFAHSTATLAGVPAISIAQGALKSMTLMNLKLAAAVTCGAVLTGGAVYQGVARTVHSGSSAKVRLASGRAVAGSQAPINLPSGIPGTEARAVALFKQVYRVYSAAKTCSFTETAESDSVPGMPFTMRYSFQRPDQFDIRMTRDGKTSHILYQNSEMLTIPLDDPAQYKSQDVRWHYHPWIDGLRIAANVNGGFLPELLFFDQREFKATLLDPNTRPRSFYLMGPPSTVNGVAVDTIVVGAMWSDTSGIVATNVVSVGHRDHLIRREVSQGTYPAPVNMSVNYTITYSDIQVDQPVPADTFQFTPPAGTPVPKPAQAGPSVIRPENRARFDAENQDRQDNFTAKESNGSKRVSLPTGQVPEEARQAATFYETVIYPAILKATHKDGKLPLLLTAVPGLESYENIGREWSTPENYRLDGTMISRPLYVNNPPDAPHDPWTCHSVQQPGTHPLLVIGWDDGTVTFNSMGDMYQENVHFPYGERTISAPPGAAGIPPSAQQNKMDSRFREVPIPR